MYKSRANFIKLEGGSYNIGQQEARALTEDPDVLKCFIKEEDIFTDLEFKEVTEMFEQYCPGINEEIRGFCDEFKVSPKKHNYYDMTWMKAGCSHCVILPEITQDGHIYVVRNYDFSDKMDDMRLCSTHVEGLYAHTGFSVSSLGRSEGMNEHGLCITNSSCGMPVGKITGLRKPVITGLQFWAVTRTLLERCKNVPEAVYLIKQLPIAYNLNMLIADPTGCAARIEMLDKKQVIREYGQGNKKQFLAAVNHGILPEIKNLQPKKMKHSKIRYKLMQEYFTKERKYTKEDIKKLVMMEYPQGLTVHNYQQYFGTLRSIIFDLTEGTLDVAFGSPLFNDWVQLKVGADLPCKNIEVNLENKGYGPEFWDMVD